MATFTITDATAAWTVYNIFRSEGLTAQAEIATFWEAAWETGLTVTSLDYATLTDDAFTFLEAEGFVTIAADELVAVELDASGKPARLRRTLEDEEVLEFLPPGEQAESI